MEVGRLFVWGFGGATVTQRLRSFFRRFSPAGVILFRRNIHDRPQLVSLTRDLRRYAKGRLLIGVDQEGGRVSRLPEPFPQFPAARLLGRLVEGERDSASALEIIRQSARFMGRGLKELGIDLNFAPVLDVDTNLRNPIIGDRSFSRDPARTGEIGVAFFRGLLDEGVIPCGKHFPGHGGTSADSHRVLPRVTKGRGGLERVELSPFRRAIRAGIPMLMTAHVLYPVLDPIFPATLSQPILTDLLRGKMGFRGVVITDDLRMKGVSRGRSILESSIMALAAGCDLLLVCRGAEEGADLVADLERIVRWSPVLKKRVAESNSRLSRLTRRAASKI